MQQLTPISTSSRSPYFVRLDFVIIGFRVDPEFKRNSGCKREANCALWRHRGSNTGLCHDVCPMMSWQSPVIHYSVDHFVTSSIFVRDSFIINQTIESAFGRYSKSAYFRYPGFSSNLALFEIPDRRDPHSADDSTDGGDKD